jgi:hypothetical protein
METPGESNSNILRYPFHVTRIDLVDEADFKNCYLRPEMTVGLVMLPAPGSPGEYTLFVRLSGETMGPPGLDLRQRCARWRGMNGFWFTFLRLINRC